MFVCVCVIVGVYAYTYPLSPNQGYDKGQFQNSLIFNNRPSASPRPFCASHAISPSLDHSAHLAKQHLNFVDREQTVKLKAFIPNASNIGLIASLLGTHLHHYRCDRKVFIFLSFCLLINFTLPKANGQFETSNKTWCLF